MSTEALYSYVYIITNTVENRYYIGSKKYRSYRKDMIGISYFSSSTDKEFIKDQKEHPYNYTYKMIAKFLSYREAIRLETRLHEIHDVARNPKFYNKARQYGDKFTTEGQVPWNLNKRMSDKARAKMSKARLGVKPWNTGKPVTDETKVKLREANLGKKQSQDTIDKRKATYRARIESNKQVKLANICCYFTGGIIATSVVIRYWAKENGYSQGHLASTARADRSAPSSRENRLQHKGIYAVYL